MVPEPSPSSPNEPTKLKWPVVLWLSQLVLVVPVFAAGLYRFIYGPSLGNVILPIWVLATLWILFIFYMVLNSKTRMWLVEKRLELVLCFVTIFVATTFIGECGIRLLGTHDEDGNFFFRGHRLHPYKLPIKKIEESLQKYKESKSAVIQFDSEIGWSPKPNSENDLFKYNSAGIRVENRSRNYGKTTPANTKRILLFGDSFTHGDEVTYKETWGHLLENTLNKNGDQVEVINLGVNGYGMDQAFLRWKKDGVQYNPDLVIFGFQAENARRNINLIRSLYNPFTGMVFSKPRFVIEGEKLVLKNSPTLSIGKILDQIKVINDWEFVKFENFYDPADFVAKKWHMSKLITFGIELFDQLNANNSAEKKTNFSKSEMELALKIIQSFYQSVNSKGAKFMVVHLPRRYMLRSFLSGDHSTTLTKFLEKVSESPNYQYVETTDALLKNAAKTSVGSLFKKSHYSLEGNKVIAKVLADHLKNTP